MFVLETEMVVKMYYKTRKSMISSFVSFIKSTGNSIPVNIVAKFKEHLNK